MQEAPHLASQHLEAMGDSRIDEEAAEIVKEDVCTDISEATELSDEQILAYFQEQASKSKRTEEELSFFELGEQRCRDLERKQSESASLLAPPGALELLEKGFEIDITKANEID